jgi:protein SCO1/2
MVEQDVRTADMTTHLLLNRRRLLGTAAAFLGAGPGGHAAAHDTSGLVTPPLAPPPLQLRLADGAETAAQRLLAGHVTALQLMFTGCSSICPIQGALFADLDRRLSAAPGPSTEAVLLSLSIDPMGDDARALSRWLKTFGAGVRWKAASPQADQLDAWLNFLQGRKAGPDRHTAQVYLFDRKGRLALRTVDFPTTSELTRLISEMNLAVF